jgi:hypothetical protein
VTSTQHIDAALLEAQRLVGQGVAKSAEAGSGKYGYKYVSTESMISACREHLNDAGLTIEHVFERYERDFVQTRMSFRDGTEVEVESHILATRFTLRHSESGECRDYPFEWPIVMEKGWMIDNAIAASMTTSIKYFLRGLLMVPQPNELEMDSRDTTPSLRRLQQTAPQPPTIGEERREQIMQRIEESGLVDDDVFAPIANWWGQQDDGRPPLGKVADWPESLLTTIHKGIDKLIAKREAAESSGPADPPDDEVPF